jgi:DNA phosphorothioation-associated putative methyltransferase
VSLGQAAHRTAISRSDLSRPTRAALDLGILRDGETFFDFGCGKGVDIKELLDAGYVASGWDPHYAPEALHVESDIVNIGYVVNVIADAKERRAALQHAWRLARKALVVAARLNAERRNLSLGRPFNDGFVTGHGTFQRFYDQSELRAWIDQTLGVGSIALAPGIFVAFRSEADANEYLFRNRQRRSLAVRVRRADHVYETHRQVLDDLMLFFTQRGRLPASGEVPELEQAIALSVGTVRRAWHVIEQVTAHEDWQGLVQARSAELLVELALLKLNRRPTFGALPATLRHDVRGLFGSYRAATAHADDLLFSVGDLNLVNELASASAVGKRLPTALYVHRSALAELAPPLRVYEGCARWLVGDVDDANLIKLATDKPKVSYLSYPTFDSDPHPALVQATYVRIRDLAVDVRSYRDSVNPPILHRKEQFVPPSYTNREKFARLTQQEERFGLFDGEVATIGTREGWHERLRERRVQLRGHRVVKAS